MKKKFWKKYWSLFVVEGCVLLLFLAVVQFSYKKEFEIKSKEIDGYTTEISKMDSFPDADSFCSHLNTLLRMDGGISHYGFVAKIYTIDGPPCYKTTKRNWLIRMCADPDKDEMETIQFDSYFSDEELEKLKDFCQVDRNEVSETVWINTFNGIRDVDVKRMLGYYNEKEQFIPVEIEFYDLYNETDTCTIQNKETKDKVSVKKIKELYQKTEGKKDGKEYLYMYLSINNMSMDLQKDAEELLEEYLNLEKENYAYLQTRERTVIHSLVELENNNDVYEYIVALCVDVKAEVLEEEGWKRELLWIFITMQLLAISIWIINFIYKRRSEKMKFMKVTFLNAMAHEMKTPAAVIKNSAECIREGIHPEKHDHYLEIIDRESDRMSHLLNSMLTYTRLTNSEYKIQWTKVAVTSIALDLCTRNQYLLEEEEIKTKFNTIREFETEGDVKLLEMVLDNFISNAIRHCEHGGEIRITSKVNGIWIFNTGSHIQEEQMEHIWDPMYQVDNARSSESKSSGMGLAISDEILRLHHLRYGVTNVAGGVEFYIWNDRY